MIHKSIEIVERTTIVFTNSNRSIQRSERTYENGSSSNRATFSQILQLGPLKIASESDRDKNI